MVKGWRAGRADKPSKSAVGDGASFCYGVEVAVTLADIDTMVGGRATLSTGSVTLLQYADFRRGRECLVPERVVDRFDVLREGRPPGA
jgi:hypothetical protein